MVFAICMKNIQKNARFSAYQYVKNIIRNNHQYDISVDIPIVLGHNEDDTVKNIITNICHQDKYDNLLGMSNFKNKSVCIFRDHFYR